MTCGKNENKCLLHKPRKLKRIGKKCAPWITRGLLHKMRKRSLIKKKAISLNDHDMWEQFKCARNQTNNAIKHVEKRHFSDNLEASKGNPRKTWNHVTLVSRKCSPGSVFPTNLNPNNFLFYITSNFMPIHVYPRTFQLRLKPFVKCQLNFRVFVSCQLFFSPFVFSLCCQQEPM